MTVFLLIVTLFVLVLAALTAFRSGADDLNWELRWRGLDADELARISTAARADDWRTSLIESEEIELATGLRRRDRRRRAYVDLAVLPFLVVASGLALVGVLHTGAVGFVLVLYGTFAGLWGYLRTRKMSGETRAVTSPEAGL